MIQQKDALVIPVSDIQSGRNIYAAIAKKLKSESVIDKESTLAQPLIDIESKKSPLTPPLIYIESKEDLNEFLMLIQVDKSGKINKTAGPLKNLLESGGILIVQWEKFSANDIASLKSLMDKPIPTLGRLDMANNDPPSKPISDKFKIINLMTPSTQCGSTFKSRTKRFL